MMFSKFRYPSFKGLSWRSTRSLSKFVGILIVAVLTALNFEWMPFLLFLTYLLYGFLRPFLSREMKRDIEEDEDEEEAKLAVLGPSPNSLPSATDSKSPAPTSEKPQH
jgi:CDP-diacylglycerol--serine O-phosphatidyltransferase